MVPCSPFSYSLLYGRSANLVRRIPRTGVGSLLEFREQKEVRSPDALAPTWHFRKPGECIALPWDSRQGGEMVFILWVHSWVLCMHC